MSSPNRPDYDQALKLLLARAHDGVVALVAPDLTFHAERSPELPSVLRQADFVWEVTSRGGTPGLLHLEVQTKVDADLGVRVADYGIRLWRRDHLPIRSVLILLRETPQTPVSPFRLTWDGAEVMQYHFHVVRLWEQPNALVLERPEPSLWPLATVMAGSSVELAVTVVERLAQADLPAGERRELTGLVAALAGLRLPRQAVLEALRRDVMIREILEESSVAQGWWEEGHERGREEGQRETVRVVLESRFGVLAADTLAALQRADATTLRTVVRHVATDSLAQVQELLGM